MTTVFASVRGYLQHPTILEIDLERTILKRVISFDGITLSNIPVTKVGFAGLDFWNGKLYAATWDKICVLDPSNGNVQDTITDERFSDIHGIHTDCEGTIWVTSTNLDGVYIIRDGAVQPFWHTWESRELRSVSAPAVLEGGRDYRTITKRDSPFHYYHVNGVLPQDDFVLISYLGPPNSYSRLRKLLVQLGIRSRRYRNGGIFVVDRKSRRLIKNIRLEGLHNGRLGTDGYIYYTEYFGNTVVRLDPCRLSMKRVRLSVPKWNEWGYLARGIFVEHSRMWVGHTVHRGWMEEEPSALIREYTIRGTPTGVEIQLPGYVGVYEFEMSAPIGAFPK